MKHTLKIYASNILLAVLAVCVFTGCATTCPISDTALGAGGAYLGHELSNGDPLATAAGAAGGVILSEALHFAAKKQSDKAYTAGYDKGKSQSLLRRCADRRPGSLHKSAGGLPGAPPRWDKSCSKVTAR